MFLTSRGGSIDVGGHWRRDRVAGNSSHEQCNASMCSVPFLVGMACHPMHHHMLQGKEDLCASDSSPGIYAATENTSEKSSPLVLAQARFWFVGQKCRNMGLPCLDSLCYRMARNMEHMLQT
jgi:hypothetical protein